jgi:signal transduction histidine kinase
MFKRGIKQKLVLSLVITILVVMTLFFILLDRYLKEYSISESDNTIFFLGQNTAPLLQRPLFTSDYNQLESIVRPILLKEFDYLVIYDNSTHDVAFRKDEKDITASFQWMDMLKGKNAFQRKDLDLGQERFTQYAFPVTSPGLTKALGFLVIGVSERNMKSKLAGITYRIVVISILLFLTLTVTIYYLSAKIVKPIKALSLKIGTFASGDYSVRSDIDSSDEIGNLSYNFNLLADKINEQIVSIEEYSKNLEEKVEERTAELLKALDAIKEKDKKLSRAEKIRSLNSVVSSIAHEINNPMSIISGNLQLMRARLDGTADETVKKRVESAQLAVERIATLIDEINFFTAIKDVDIAPFSFSNLLENVISMKVPGDVSIAVDGPEKGGAEDKIDSNAHLLTVSLESIIKNSVEMFRHRDIDGKIEVRYYHDSPYFKVEVIDNAGGIDEIGRVFDPFYTTFNEKKGLGLTFVYHAIQALNGEVRVENIESGDTGEKGAKVTLMLPMDVEPDDDELSGPWLP